MIHASAIAESIVAPTLFRPEFSHSQDPERTWGTVRQSVQFYSMILCNALIGNRGPTPALAGVKVQTLDAGQKKQGRILKE